MRIHIRCKTVELNEAVRAHIEHRLQFCLGRLSPRILRVKVQILDCIGPDGAKRKACQIDVRLLPKGDVVVQDADADFYAAFYRAADRAARAVARAINRDATQPRGTQS